MMRSFEKRDCRSKHVRSTADIQYVRGRTLRNLNTSCNTYISDLMYYDPTVHIRHIHPVTDTRMYLQLFAPVTHTYKAKSYRQTKRKNSSIFLSRSINNNLRELQIVQNWKALIHDYYLLQISDMEISLTLLARSGVIIHICNGIMLKQ